MRRLDLAELIQTSGEYEEEASQLKKMINNPK
jgi:hypothetical protein